jgi:hypothetical protein
MEMVMELKDFISATLSGIVEGVVEAQSKVKGLGAHVNPGGLMRAVASASSDAIWDNQTNNLARVVRFDIALNVEQGTGTQAKVGVVAGIFGLEAGGESQSKKVAVHRVEFAVPVLFPSSDLPEEARMRHQHDQGPHPSR